MFFKSLVADMERLCNDVRLSCKLLYVLWIQKSLLFAIASGGR